MNNIKINAFRLFIGAIVLLTLTSTLYYWLQTSATVSVNGKKCFQNSHEVWQWNVQMLEDILLADKKPQMGKSVFFHETSCSRSGLVELSARQACAIESAAKSSPSWDVFLLFASPSGFSNSTPKSPVIMALETYSNIYMRNVNLWTYASQTPAIKWLYDEELFSSSFLSSHMSDFLRYLSLFKWGGTYVDLDVIVKKDLNEISPNYAGAESNKDINSAILNFDHTGIGHDIAEFCLREFQLGFDGSDWGHNGPGVITRVLKKICQTSYTPSMSRSRCHTFNVYPVDAFYAVPWEYWRYFFEPVHADRTLRMTKDSIAVHLWNKYSITRRVIVGSRVAYGLLAAKYCPRVYAASLQFF